MADGGKSTPAPASAEPGPPSGDRAWKILAAVAGTSLIAFILFVALKPHPSSPQVAKPVPATTFVVGHDAPLFSLPRLGGGPQVAYRPGGPTIVNFFASWCRDCQAELDNFATLDARRLPPLQVIGVDTNDTSTSTAQRLLAAAHATYPVGVDANAAVATEYLLNALPVTFYISPQGRVIHVGVGAQSSASLQHWEHVLSAGAKG